MTKDSVQKLSERLKEKTKQDTEQVTEMMRLELNEFVQNIRNDMKHALDITLITTSQTVEQIEKQHSVLRKVVSTRWLGYLLVGLTVSMCLAGGMGIAMYQMVKGHQIITVQMSGMEISRIGDMTLIKLKTTVQPKVYKDGTGEWVIEMGK